MFVYLCIYQRRKMEIGEFGGRADMRRFCAILQGVVLKVRIRADERRVFTIRTRYAGL